MGSAREACLATLASVTLAVMTTCGSTCVQRTFRVLRKLGNGNFGSVFEIQAKAAAGKTIACKQIKRTHQGDVDFQQELSMLKLLGYHSNLNLLTGWCQTKSFSYLMLDMCHGGTLEDMVNKTGSGFTENQAAGFITSLLETTKYIHGKGVLHNDLKPDNIFLARKDDPLPHNLVIGDFGLANTLQHYTKNWDQAGTPGWMAPEVREGVHSQKTDVFSLGAILFFMVTGTRPFKTSSVGRHTYYAYGHIGRMLKLRGVSGGLKACILSMLAEEPGGRYSMTEALHDPWLLAATKLDHVATCSHPYPRPTSPYPAPPQAPPRIAPAASNTSKRAVNKTAFKTVPSPRRTRAGTRIDIHAPITRVKAKAQPVNANLFSASLGKGDLENVNPNPQHGMHTSKIPGPRQQTTVNASLPMSPSFQTANQPDSASPHPHVSAANIARPTRLPSPPLRAAPSVDASQYNAAAATSPSAPSDASAPVDNDVMPAQEIMVAAAQPTAVAKPSLVPRRHLPLQNKSASLLGPAAGATANCERSSSTAPAPALTAPSKACTSAQTTTLTAGNTKTMSKSQAGAGSAAAACGAPAPSDSKAMPVPRTTAEVRDAVKKVPAASGQPIVIPVARCTRAATRQRAVAAKSKPHTSSTVPVSSAPQMCSSFCDSDSMSGDETDPASSGAAAVSQRLGALRTGSPEAAPVMMANPLFAGHRTSPRVKTGLPINAVKAQADLHPSNHVLSTVQREQAGARPKRSRNGQASYDSAVPADESKGKKVRFTEPLKDAGHAYCTFSSTQEPTSTTAATHRQAADGSKGARRSKTPPQAATKCRGRRNTRKQATASVVCQAGASAEAPAPKPIEHILRLEPIRTRAATRAATVPRPENQESAAAVTRSKRKDSTAAVPSRPKRKVSATAASAEEEQLPIAKRARAVGAGSSFRGRTVPRPVA